MDENLQTHHQIYDQLYENPFLPIEDIAGVLKMPVPEVTQHVDTMHESSLLLGPVISVKPASNYHMYCSFLKVTDPYARYKEPFKRSYVSKSWTAGTWDFMVVTEEEMDFTGMEGVRECVYQGKKGGTFISKCVHVDWENSMKDILSRRGEPGEETVFYEKVPLLTWGEKEWMLYYAFRLNARRDSVLVLKELDIDCEIYEKWVSSLPEVAYVQPAFYPSGSNVYGALDFLLKSDYQKQLITILGLLPCSGVFFSTGDAVWARLPVRERDDIRKVNAVMSYLKIFGYITDAAMSLAMSTIHRGDLQGDSSIPGTPATGILPTCP
ncbi:MAG: hypothetical protein HXS40_13625, partial [Theionarchaea archaeon]|nr:hypothetical protein [Theionarchaea archaeon]